MKRPASCAAFLPVFLPALLLPASAAAGPPSAPQDVRAVAEGAVHSQDTVTVNGEVVPYEVTAGTLPVHGRDGKVLASLFYVAYRRTGVEDPSRRPLMFSFNGGPGSASVWMHVGYTGPRFLEIDDEGFPVQPYGLRENPHSVLDVADLVYVDPVNTGFSRPMEGVEARQFFGVREDVEYLARWIDLWVSRHGRWLSPKFLIGESYGTTRVAGLARRLQGSHWMYLNGVVLVSPTSLGVARDGPVADALRLPHYAATAWHHGRLEEDLQGRDLAAVLSEVEAFTLDAYLPALARGGFLEEAGRDAVAGAVARYAGVGEAFVRHHNLALPVLAWRKELLRDEGFTVGRLDARYRGVDRQAAGERPEHDPALAAWNHAFTPAINHYLRDVLGYATDLQYHIFGPVSPWDRTADRTGEDLRRAMAENSFLRVLVQAGYYDGATDYFSAKYTLWQLDPSGRLRDRFRFEGYRSGHMMYLRREDLAASNDHVREFIRASLPPPGRPARW